MKNKAFSLIEIIVAVAIIATLSGLIGLKLKNAPENRDIQI